MQRMLEDRFGVPAHDAEVLAREVFLTHLTFANEVDDFENLLLAAAVHSGEKYRRSHAAAPPDATAEEMEALRDRMWLSDAMATLPARVREMVRLRFREHMTYEQVAAELDVPVFYVQKAVKRELLRLLKLRKGISR